VPGQTGWLVPPHDPEALSRALLEAANSPERCVRYGQQARLRVEREFSLARTVEAYEHLWAGVLGLRLPDARLSPTDSSTRNVEVREPVV
jgi:glycosyltransferase involved in cell wall biosynthesis